MSDPLDGSDFRSDLTTAPIFDDALYFSEALNFPQGQNEDDVDTQLALSARDSGIDDPYRHLCPDLYHPSTMSTLTLSSEQRSSMSIHSRETQSTGTMSYPSRASRTSGDFRNVDYASPMRKPPMTRNSLSHDSYDAVMERYRPAQHRHSGSAASGTNSLFRSASVAAAANGPAKPSPRKHKRASGIFAMFRRDSSSCPSRSHHGHHSKPQTPKLECGHALSRYAVRVHIEEALGADGHTAPSCCGKPLPRVVLEAVLSKDEVDIVSSSTVSLRSPGLSSLQDSGYSEDGISSIDIPTAMLPQSTRSDVSSMAPAIPSKELTPEEEERLRTAIAGASFKQLQAQQMDQLRRVSAFEMHQRKALSAYYHWTQKQAAAQLEASKTQKTKQHAVELERLDEFQIAAEHDLRKAHAQEAQNVATALKYMTAFCSGNNPANPDVAHKVTDEDRKKLARQYATQEKLPAKHESAINVLRARQEKDAKTKLLKQQAELHQLDTDFEREKRTFDLQYLKDLNRLDSMIEARRRRLMHRWALSFEIWRREWENQDGNTLVGQLPKADWPDRRETDNVLEQTSPLAIYLQLKS
ncbi:hypothetical protein BU24DRAFT_43452 [Aaosphaeria arxii CBS 175.79]|uniref:Uncharacterized protein n=1 Tax=Aaosphaeria arxii CBS 175.79 TaxID=1450172 RepID=A0A6A5YCB9_9PLEO|nr:uncharacterized protein BU24DRAFT_43452 [Aaosphaeria arxii CBS 175.79]KAF2022340.1 hypothetical protein BU24DRAFT_43452 [Aaosphaeria arxii CBS 175.79]